MYNHKETKRTNGPQRRSNVTKNDKKQESININLIGPRSSTITVHKRDEEERGKLYNVYEISVPSKSKPNVDSTKQVREVTPENYKQSLNTHRVPDNSRRLNVPSEDDILQNVSSKKNESSKKKESFQDREVDDTEFESDRNYRDDKGAEEGLYRLKRDYNTFAIPTLTEKDKQQINKFSLSEDSPTSSLGDFSIKSSLDLKQPLLNKPKENKKVSFSKTHARSENRKPLDEPIIKKTTQIEPKYLIPDTKMTPKLVIPTIIEPREKFRHSDSFNNFSDIKWNDDLENTSLDSEIFHDIGITSQLNKPKEKKKISITTPHDRHKNEKPFIKKLTQVGPQYLKPECKMKTNTFRPTIIEPRDDLSDMTKDSSIDSDFLSFLSSDTSLPRQLNKPEGMKKTFLTTPHDRHKNEKPFIKKLTQVGPQYLKPENKMKTNILTPTTTDLRDNLSDITKLDFNYEDGSIDSDLPSFLSSDTSLTSQLNKPEGMKKSFLTTPHDRHKNEKPFIKKLTQVGPQYLKPENKMKTNILTPTTTDLRDNLSDITKLDFNYEDGSIDSDLPSFLSSDTSLTSQLNKPEGNETDSTSITTRRYERKYKKIVRTITPGTLKPTKLEPTKLSPISESLDNLSDITKWHDDLEDSSLESLKSQYRPSQNSLTRFPEILPEVNKLFAEPFGEKSTLAYSPDFNDDNEEIFDKTSVVEKHSFYTDNLLDPLKEINSISSLEGSEEKDNFNNVGQHPWKINNDRQSVKIIKPPEESEAPKTINETLSLKNYNQMKPRDDYFDENLPYLQKPSIMKPKDSVTFLDKNPSLPSLTDSARRSTISENYFDKNIPYLGKTPAKNENLDEIIYSTILSRPLDEIFETSSQDSKKARKSYERYFDEHLPYLENRPKELKLETENVKSPFFETYFDQIPESLKTQKMSTTSENYIDEHLPFLDIKNEKIETKNDIVQPTSLKKSPDQISNSESQKSEKSSTSSGKYFNKLLSYFIKKPDREETISMNSKGSKASSGKYFNKNIPYLFKKSNTEETDNKKPDNEEIIAIDSKGSKRSSINSEKYSDDNISNLIKKPDIEENILSLRDSPTSSGTHSDENKPLKKNTIVVSDEFQVMPYLEQSRAPISDSESNNSKRSSQVEKLESEYEEIPENRIKDKNGQWIFMGDVDETNPFDHQNTFDGNGVESSNNDDDSNFDSDPEHHFSKRKRLKEENHNDNANGTNIYSENGKRLINDVKRNGSDERITSDTVPLHQEQGGRRTTTRSPSVSWNGEVRTNDNNTLERTSIPRNSRFYNDIYAGNELQVLPLQVPIDNNAFVPDRNQVGSLENKPGKMSIVEERDQAKRTGYPYRNKSVEGPIKYKETIPRRNTYNDEYRTPEYKIPQTERRSLNYPIYKDKNTMTDGSYNPHNNQDELWFGTIKSQTYGPGDIDNTPSNDRPSKPRYSSVRPSERQSPRYSEINDDRRGLSIPGRKSTKYSDKRPSSVISLPQKENIILDKKLPKSADDATPAVRDEKKPKKKRFKSFHLPTSKPQDNSNFGVVGTAVLSHKPIPPKENSELLNKDLACSLRIKGSKINAICNLYFDPRLKELLLDQLGFIGGEIRRRRNKKKRKADENIYLADSTSSTVAK